MIQLIFFLLFNTGNCLTTTETFRKNFTTSTTQNRATISAAIASATTWNTTAKVLAEKQHKRSNKMYTISFVDYSVQLKITYN